MELELKLNGSTIVRAEIDIFALEETLQVSRGEVSQSTAISVVQAKELLRRIDEQSVEFLRVLVSNGGSATWQEMQKIFGFTENDSWNEYSTRYGKGITRAFRHITGGKHDVLVHWNDDDPEWNDPEWTDARVYVDGLALKSLQKAFDLAK